MSTFISANIPGASLAALGFHGEERLSGLFHYTLRLTTATPPGGTPQPVAAPFDKMLGKPAWFSVLLPTGKPRYFHGIVSRFVQKGHDPTQGEYHYDAELRPWLWFLTMRTNSQIFHKKDAVQIIEAVLKEAATAAGCKPDFKKQLKKKYDKREYCVQYQESDFDFISRLMEDEGIFYFFEHTKTGHTMVLADDAEAHKPTAQPNVFLGEPQGQKADFIYQLTYDEQLVTNAYQLTDYNYLKPSVDLKVKVKTAPPGEKSMDLQVYDYPGNYDKSPKGNKKKQVRVDAAAAPAKNVRGRSFCRALATGYKFDLIEKKLNLFALGSPLPAGKPQVVRWVYHEAMNNHYSSYYNRFETFPVKWPFRPPRLTKRPYVAGTQTAVVVGAKNKEGDDIWVDKHGRVLVRFHWSKYAKDAADKCSCFVRVAQGWAGAGWGQWFLPRLGHEVVITFEEGDPDRPLITGAVYNAENKQPYKLPAAQTKSTVKSNSFKGGKGFNEIRFEDKKDKEEIYVHAQKDMFTKVLHNSKVKVFMDNKIHVGRDRFMWVSGYLEERSPTRHEYHGKRKIYLGAKVKQKDGSYKIYAGYQLLHMEKGPRIIILKDGNETHKVKGKRNVHIIKDEEHKNKANFTHLVKKDFTLKVKGNLTIEVDGKISIKSKKTIVQKADMGIKLESGKGISVKAAMDMKMKAGTQIEAKATMIDIKASAMGKFGGGIAMIKGGLVKIN